MKLTLDDKRLKRSLIWRTEKLMEAVLGHPKYKNYDIRKSCLLWAWATIQAGKLIRGGLQNLQLQGGSAGWRIVLDSLDDGVSPTHYSYVYTDPEDSIDLGEIHFWAAVAPQDDSNGNGLIVDLTTKYVPDLAREKGLELSCAPPMAIWSRPDEIKLDCYYEPCLEAIIHGNFLIKEIHNIL